MGTFYDVSEADDLPRGARRVRTALLELGLPGEIHRLADSTRTAPEAAAGHPHAVFPIAPQDLAKAARATVLSLAERSG
jgi:hypothetical protein